MRYYKELSNQYKAGPSLSRRIGTCEVFRYGKGKYKVEREAMPLSPLGESDCYLLLCNIEF